MNTLLDKANYSIRSNFVLVTVLTGSPRSRVQVKKEATKVENDNNAKHGILKQSVALWDINSDIIKQLGEVRAEFRKYHDRVSRPWSMIQKGKCATGLLPVTELQAYRQEYVNAQARIRALLSSIEPQYDALRAEALTSLGEFANELDINRLLPVYDVWAAQYRLDIKVDMVPEQSDVNQLHLPPEQAAEIMHEMERTQRAEMDNLLTGAFQSVGEIIQRIINQTDGGETESGRAKGVSEGWWDSLESVVYSLEAFNLYDDPKFTEIIAGLKRLMRFDVTDVRKDSWARREMNTAATSVANSLADMGF